MQFFYNYIILLTVFEVSPQFLFHVLSGFLHRESQQVRLEALQFSSALVT